MALRNYPRKGGQDIRPFGSGSLSLEMEFLVDVNVSLT
jgi:hypothetical protein